MVWKQAWSAVAVLVLAVGTAARAVAQNVAEVDVQPRDVMLAVGERREVLATAYDAQGDNILTVIFRWVSSDPGIVRVEEDPSIAGVAYMIGVSAGLTQVVVSVGDSSRSIAVSVSGVAVTGPVGTGVATVIEVDPLAVSLLPGEDIGLRLRFLKDDGSLAAPIAVTWRSFNAEVAAVSPEGVVTGISLGNTLVEAVAAGMPPRRITVEVSRAQWGFATPVVSLAPIESDTITVVVPEQGNRKLNPRLLSWRSTDLNIVAVSPIGIATGVSAGEAEIIAVGFGQEMRVKTTVHRPVEAMDVVPAGDTVFVPMGGKAVFRATPLAADDSPIPEAPLVWEVGDPSVLGFDPATSEATGKKIGTSALIVRTPDGGLSKTWTAQVVATGIVLNVDRVGLSLTDRLTLTASFADTAGNPLSRASQVTWTSSNPAVATVDAQGMLVPADVGYTEIVAGTPWGNADTAHIFVQGEGLVASNRAGTFDIYAFDRTATDMYPVMVGPGQETEPVHSPDGSRVAFVTDRDGNNEIYVTNADGSSSQRLTASAAVEGAPAWTPDGRQILYHSDAGGTSQIWIMNADGADQRQLTNSPGGNSQPAVSPDGRQVAFTSTRDQNHEIYLMGLDGSNQRNFSASPAVETSPTWVGDTAIAYLRESRDGRTTLSQVVRMNFQRQVEELSQPVLTVAEFAISKNGDLLVAIVMAPGPTGAMITRMFLLPLGGVGVPTEVPRAGETETLSNPSFRR